MVCWSARETRHCHKHHGTWRIHFNPPSLNCQQIQGTKKVLVKVGQAWSASVCYSSCFSLASTRFSWHCGMLLWGGKVCGGHRQRHQDWGHKTAHLALYCDETGAFYLKQLLKWEAMIFCRENNGKSLDIMKSRISGRFFLLFFPRVFHGKVRPSARTASPTRALLWPATAMSFTRSCLARWGEAEAVGHRNAMIFFKANGISVSECFWWLRSCFSFGIIVLLAFSGVPQGGSLGVTPPLKCGEERWTPWCSWWKWRRRPTAPTRWLVVWTSRSRSKFLWRLMLFGPALRAKVKTLLHLSSVRVITYDNIYI